MFILNRTQFVKPEILECIKQKIIKLQTNLENNIHINKENTNTYLILPFVSLLSFFAGYNFRNLIHK